jgi:uncharacterized membrane protein HdeD (DUF308 family)
MSDNSLTPRPDPSPVPVSETSPTGASDVLAARAGWHWPLGIGLVLLLLGVACFYKVLNGSDQDHMFVGVMMIAAGLAQAAHAASGLRWSNFTRDIAPALLFLFGGVIVISDPLTGSFVLTLLLAAALVLTMVFRIVNSMREEALGGWQVIALAGAISAGLWIWLLWTWPRSGLWVLGTVVGLELLASGLAWLQSAWKARGA